MLITTKLYSFPLFFIYFYPRHSLGWLFVSCNGLKIQVLQVRNQNILELDDLTWIQKKYDFLS